MIYAGLTVAVIGILLLTFAPEADAHKLLAVDPDNTMFQTAQQIPNPFEGSYFTLERFEREGQSHWYSFIGIEGEEIFIQTLVPDIDLSRDFTPCFDLLIGQDKATPEVMKKPFVEEFSGTEWIITCELTMTLPDDGLYYIRAHDELHHYSVGDTGKFSLGIGIEEDFTIFDWIQVPFWLMHMNLFFENNVLVWIMLVLVLILAVIILVAISRRGTNTRP